MDNILCSTEINQYVLYEKAEHSLYERHCIDGKIVGCSKCCGYCQCEEHPGFLTEKLRNQHNCIAKQCFHYIGKPKKEKSTLQKTHDRSSLILSLAKQISDKDEGVRVLRVESGKVLNHYTAFFVTITNDYSFEEYIEEIYQSIGVCVAFRKLDYDFDKCVALIQAN